MIPNPETQFLISSPNIREHDDQHRNPCLDVSPDRKPVQQQRPCHQLAIQQHNSFRSDRSASGVHKRQLGDTMPSNLFVSVESFVH